MDSDDPVAMLRQMVQIDSVTGSEDELSEHLVARMRALGFAARRDEAGNAIGEIGAAEGPVIMLLGHLDTVPGRLPVFERDGVLYGRGAVDAKGPLAALLWAAARAGAHCPARLVMVGAVGEEGVSPGARHLLDGPAPDAVIIGEPSGASEIVIGYKGIIRLALDVARPWAHSSGPAPKAVEEAVGFWCDLRDHVAGLHPVEPLFGRAVASLEELCGDLGQARARISCRLPPGFDPAAFRAWLRERAGPDTVTVLEDLPAVRSPRTDPVVRALHEAVRRNGVSPTAKVKLGTSDMNVVGPRWRVPIAAYGPGDGRLSHSDDEHLLLSDYALAIDVLSDAIADLAQVIRPGPASRPSPQTRPEGTVF